MGTRTILSRAIAFAVMVIAAALSGRIVTAEPLASAADFFESRVRPVLVQHCYQCHSATAEKVKGGLRLDSRDAMLKGGVSGPAIVPGHPEKSRLIEAIRYANPDTQMPPKTRLPDQAVADLTRWVQQGAIWPGGTSRAAPTADKSGPRNLTGIDYATLKKEHWAWQPVKRDAAPPPVKNETWPRTPIDRFLLAAMEERDLRPVADADHLTLLRRVTFDLIGLPPTPAEVDAFLHDPSPSAFEAVVDRLLASPRFGERWGRHWLDVARYAESTGSSRNVPYPQAWRYRDYVIDAFNADKPYDRFVTEQVAGDLLPYASAAQRDAQLVATGFLAIGVKDLNEKDRLKYTMDNVDEQIDVTTRAVLGLTVACARCHDHKFDPVPTADYYALAGIFTSTEILAGVHNKKGAGGGKAYAGGNLLLKLSRPDEEAVGVRDDPALIGNARICVHGETDNLGPEVPRGTISLVHLPGSSSIAPGRSGRLELAHWLVSPENPLAARVMANRVWQHLFGEGLVRTTDNFGTTGEPPSHPALLDYLATRFVQQKWSVKRLIREIVLTRAYQLGGAYDATNAAIDPADRYLWRAAPRRLEAEALRDAMLAASGQLQLTPPVGSPVMRLPVAVIGGKKGGRGGAFDGDTDRHRSVYLPVVRELVPDVLDVFDFPEPELVAGSRDVTTVPTQALFLLNDPFVLDQAKAMAQRVKAESAVANDESRVDLAYRLALCRPPTDAERARAMQYVAQYAASAAGGDSDPHQRAWESLCQALFTSAEFRYVR